VGYVAINWEHRLADSPWPWTGNMFERFTNEMRSSEDHPQEFMRGE